MREFLARFSLILGLIVPATLTRPSYPLPSDWYCYVKADATGTPDGKSWLSAYTELGPALADPTCRDIWVARGVYYAGVDPADSFVVPTNVRVHGGFAGTETELGLGQPKQNLTVLSGDIDNNDLRDANGITVDHADIRGNNSFHVVVLETPTGPNGSALEGLVITGGDGGMDHDGGGVFCDGHGLYMACGSSLRWMVLTGNRARNGGAVFTDGSQGGRGGLHYFDVTLTRNRAELFGGAVHDTAEAGTIEATFGSVVFRDNEAGRSGGGIYINAGATGNAHSAFTDTSFIGNIAIEEYGGAVFSSGGGNNPNFAGCAFVANQASGAGGAVMNIGADGVSEPAFHGVTFYGNAAAKGGAVVNLGGTNPEFNRVTFSRNAAGYGGAVFNEGAGGAPTPSFKEVILWDDFAAIDPEVHNMGATPTYSYSLIQGSGGSGANWDTTLGTDLGGNLDEDPLLAPLMDDLTVPLLWGSPAIDSGDPSLCGGDDQRDVNRPQGPRCDMGALERVQPSPHADLDGDGRADMLYFRPATGLWGGLQSSYDFGYDFPRFLSWGEPGDTAFAVDIDDFDHKLDPTVLHPASGGASAAFRTLLSMMNYSFNVTVTEPAGWPGLGDHPVPADYDGDGHFDAAVWRALTGAWLIPRSNSYEAWTFTSWGLPGDTPVAGDMDGDGRADIGYFREAEGLWGFLLSTMYYSHTNPIYFSWGAPGDMPILADYDGDGKADPAVVTPPAGDQSAAYRILRSTTGYDYGQSWTIPAGWPALGDTPVTGDYDGDGLIDAGIWRASTGVWIIPKSSTGNTSYIFAAWGAPGDQPVH